MDYKMNVAALWSLRRKPGNNFVMLTGDGGFVAGRRCIVGPYSEVRKQCQGGQAHHIVPDTLNRVGNRKQGAKGIDRIKDTPSLHDGPSICLQGNARTQGTEHNTAHQCDVLIQAAGQRTDNSPEGTIPVAEALELAMESVIAVRPDCAEAIKTKVKQAYYPDDKDYSNDDRLLNAAGQPASAEARKHLRISAKINSNGSKKFMRTKGN